jgi:hypothetical protein
MFLAQIMEVAVVQQLELDFLVRIKEDLITPHLQDLSLQMLLTYLIPQSKMVKNIFTHSFILVLVGLIM